MKTDQALTLFEPKTIDELKARAEILVKSGILPSHIKTPETAIAITIAGRELGLPMMESFRSIYVIQGTPTLRPQTMLALIHRSGLLEDYSIEEATQESKRCTVSMTRKGYKPQVVSFSMAEAVCLGLDKKDNYLKQWPTMLRWRAISKCARLVFPDVINGMYTPEEIETTAVEIDPKTEEVKVLTDVSKPEIRTGVFLGANGRELRIDELDDNTIEHFKIPYNYEWEGKDGLGYGKTLMECFSMPPRENGRTPGLLLLHQAAQNHPIQEVREVVFKFLEKVNPDYQAGLPLPPPPSDGFEPIDASEPKMNEGQRKQLVAIAEKNGMDVDGLLYGAGINPKTVTQRQAERLIRKDRAEVRQGAQK